MIGKFLVRFFVFAAACHQASTYYVLPPPRCPLQHFLYARAGAFVQLNHMQQSQSFQSHVKRRLGLGAICYIWVLADG